MKSGQVMGDAIILINPSMAVGLHFLDYFATNQD
jgi:hypothetical protein